MNMIEWLRSLIVEYGGINVLIMVLTIVFTNLIKIPIKKKAQKITNIAKVSLGVDLDKGVITSNIVYIPIGVSFILYLIYTLCTNGFNFVIIDWGKLVSNSLVYGMLSVSIFDMVKSKLQAYKSKDTYEDVKLQLSTETNTVETTTNEVKSESKHDLLVATNNQNEIKENIV